MEKATVTKKLIIEHDLISGEMTFKNEDDMTYAELLSVLEYTKWMIHRDWIRSE